MSEIEAIVGIYGAVDDAVRSDRELRSAVSRLLPLYRDPKLHWYDDFEAWLKRNRRDAESAEPLFPRLQPALDELAGSAPRCRMRARRLFALAVAMRAVPELRDPNSELGSLAVSALRVPSLAAKKSQALDLYELLANDELLVSADGTTTHDLSAWWDHLIATAHAQQLISDTTAMRPRPCSGRLLKMPGVAGPVAVLVTEFETEDVEFDAATRFIEPENWERCMPWFWCEMRETGRGVLPGEYRYHEVVSSNCQQRASAAFFAETDLLFNFMWLPDKEHAEVALTNYQLSDGRPLAGDLIRVDEGTLVVEKVGPGQTPLRITTTKRVQFSNPFSTEALAMIMCALGYADVSGDLLCCAANQAGVADAGTAFPGESPPANPPGAAPRAASARRTAGSWAGERESMIGDVVQDAVGMWARILRESADVMERGAAGAGASAQSRTRERSEG